MHAGGCFHYHLEWPPARTTTVAGPVVWLQGWIIGQAGYDFIDLRVRVDSQIHLGLLGLPRVDLAAHFQSPRPWLPAGFTIGVPLPDGPTQLFIEALDTQGVWHSLQTLDLTVAATGASNPQPEGAVTRQADGNAWTLRDAHRPFHGHLDEPAQPVELNYGQAEIFGWLLHESASLQTVLASTDLLVFNHLQHSLPDPTLATKVALPKIDYARLQGTVDVPLGLANPACLRIYAQLQDGSVQLCFAQRLILPEMATEVNSVASPTTDEPTTNHQSLADLPSGRPRRLLLSTLNLQADDATWRALDVGRHLVATQRWVVRLITTVDGPLRGDFEAAGIAVQIVDPLMLFSAPDPAAVAQAISDLDRRIWWPHLDAVAVFDPLCFWAITLGRQHSLPVLFDCSVDQVLTPPLDVSPALAAAIVAGWQSASQVCYPATISARLQNSLLGSLPAIFVPHWCDQYRVNEPSLPKYVIAPIGGRAHQGGAVLLRTVAWLSRQTQPFPWRIAVNDLRGAKEENALIQDIVLNQPAMMTTDTQSINAAAALVCPTWTQPPVRALLNAAAAGVPIITTPSPIVSAIFSPQQVILVPQGDSRALARALRELATDPAAAAPRAQQAQAQVLSHHSAASALPQWQAALESMVAQPELK